MKVLLMTLLLFLAQIVPVRSQNLLPTHIVVPSQTFGEIGVRGGATINSSGNISKRSRFHFALPNGKIFSLPVTGYSLSLYPDRTGIATLYFGEEVTNSDYIQVRGEIVVSGGKRFLQNTFVTALYLLGEHR